MAIAGDDGDNEMFPRRPGPEEFPADTWESASASSSSYAPSASAVSAFPPDTGVDGSSGEAYQGRHHLAGRAAQMWVAVAIVLVGLTAVIGAPYVFANFLHPDSGAPVPLPLPVGSDAAAADATGGLAMSTNFSPTPEPTTAAPTATTVPATTRPPAPKPTTVAPPFAPVTIEAEAGSPQVTLRGSAFAANYPDASGGRLVRNLGDWDMSGGPGSLQFNNVVIPTAGTYVITLFFVHPDNERNRGAVLTVSGVPPVNVTFSGNSTCCGAKKVSVAIPAGTHTILIANTNGRAPSIDKIVIGRT